MADKVKLKNSCNKAADKNGTHDEQPAILTDTNNIVLQSRFNSGIIVGKNPKKKKETDAGEIDMAVGRVDNAESKVLKKDSLKRGSAAVRKASDKNTNSFAAGDAAMDAARVLISQKCEIDNDWNLGTGPTRSAVGIKADAVRIVSRDVAGGIKLIVKPEEVNSMDGNPAGVAGIELVGSGDEKMESMVKSDQLAIALSDLTVIISDIKNMLNEFQMAQRSFNAEVARKVDVSPFYAAPVVVDPALIAGMSQTNIQLYNMVEGDARAVSGKIYEFTTNHLGNTRSIWREGCLW